MPTDREQETKDYVRRHFQERHEAACPVIGTETLPRGVKTSLAEQVMAHVPDHERFSGQATLEVHCKDGAIRDVYLTTRRKMGPD